MIEVLIASQSKLISDASFIAWYGFASGIILFAILRIKESYSVKRALLSACFVLLLFFYVGYDRLNVWYKYSINETHLTFFYANGKTVVAQKEELVSVMPRFGSYRCSIIVKTDSSVFKSAEIDQDKGWHLTRKIAGTNTN